MPVSPLMRLMDDVKRVGHTCRTDAERQTVTNAANMVGLEMAREFATYMSWAIEQERGAVEDMLTQLLTGRLKALVDAVAHTEKRLNKLLREQRNTLAELQANGDRLAELRLRASYETLAGK